MTQKVEIERRFAPTAETQLSDPDYLSYFGDQPHGVKNWSDCPSSEFLEPMRA